jgi:hypothetical protein
LKNPRKIWVFFFYQICQKLTHRGFEKEEMIEIEVNLIDWERLDYWNWNI